MLRDFALSGLAIAAALGLSSVTAASAFSPLSPLHQMATPLSFTCVAAAVGEATEAAVT